MITLEFQKYFKMEVENLKLVRDAESLNIYVDNGEDKDPIHIVYWTEDEWLEDPETVVPAMMIAMELFYTGQHVLLFKTLKLEHLLEGE